MRVLYRDDANYFSTLDGVHSLTLKEIEYGIRDFFTHHKIDDSNILFDHLFFNMTDPKRAYHPEIIFAIESILLVHANNKHDNQNEDSPLLINQLFNWDLVDLDIIKNKYHHTQCLKIKISPKTNVLLLAKYLNALYENNPNIKFRLDANRNFEINEILIFIKTLKAECIFTLQNNIEYLEEPLKSSNDLLDLKTLCHIPYAADESAGAYILHPTKLIDVIVLKPALYGMSYLYRFIKNNSDKKIIISSCFEHPSTLRSLYFLARLKSKEHHGIVNELSL